MTNDGALEASYQGEIVFAYLAGGRDNLKKYVLRANRQFTYMAANSCAPIASRAARTSAAASRRPCPRLHVLESRRDSTAASAVKWPESPARRTRVRTQSVPGRALEWSIRTNTVILQALTPFKKKWEVVFYGGDTSLDLRVVSVPMPRTGAERIRIQSGNELAWPSARLGYTL